MLKDSICRYGAIIGFGPNIKSNRGTKQPN